MKKLILLIIFIFSVNAFSQVIIGDNVGTAVNKTSVLLEFGKNDDAGQNNKGLIMPYVETLQDSKNYMAGTILLHADENGAKSRVKYFNGSQWIDLSGRDGDVITSLKIQEGKTEEPNAKVIIGDKDSTAKGALVLDSQTKAMVLPIVEDVNNIPSPSPGMIVYVKKEGAKRLAVFNGSKWSFWKP